MGLMVSKTHHSRVGHKSFNVAISISVSVRKTSEELNPFGSHTYAPTTLVWAAVMTRGAGSGRGLKPIHYAEVQWAAFVGLFSPNAKQQEEKGRGEGSLEMAPWVNRAAAG